MTIITGVMLVLVGIVQQPVVKPSVARETVEGTVSRGLHLLKRQEYATFLTELYTVETLSSVARGRSLDVLVSSLQKSGHFDMTQQLLEAASRSVPRIANRGTLAYYTFAPSVAQRSNLALTKVGRQWYLLG